MKNLFLAKSNPRETIIEHTENLLEQYKIIKNIYPNIQNINWELLYLSCLYHDLGKMNTKFQNKIIKNINEREQGNFNSLDDKELKNIKEIPHGYLSSAFIPVDYLKKRFTEEETKILYESIFYHHNREKLEGDRKKDLVKVIKEDLSKYKDEFKYEKLLPCKKLNTKFMKYLRSRVLDKNKLVKNDGSINKEGLEVASKLIITKGLLNKIDFAASSDITVEYESGDLQEKTEQSIEQYGLNKLQKFMKKNQNNNVIVKASTGIGKTEGALIWIGNNKGFFTLPLRVSINSIYDRIIDKEKIGYEKEKVALLHSDTASEYIKREEDGIIDKAYFDSTKQLSIPLTVCTVDQLIGFIFKYEGFELKLATLSYSKLVIDEIQMYSSDMVAYLILAIRDIVAMGGKFAILTATFPPIFEYFMNFVGLKEGEDYIKPEEPFLKEKDGKSILRHKINVYEKNIDAETIIKNAKGKKVLVIVNTVKTAQRLYDDIKENKKYNGIVNVFHSKFIKEDRTIKESEIFQNGKLENEFEGIWITTQVVEASLDIDFDVLYTELSDIAGLLQRMGRVYRNRLLEIMESNIHVFVGNSAQKPSGISYGNSIIDIDIFEKSKDLIMQYNNCELDEKEKMIMVDKVYSVENLKESKYFRSIVDTINAFNNIEPYNLKKNEARLRDISSETIIPKIIYKNNKEYIDNLIEQLKKEKDFSKRVKIKDNIMKKTLSIPFRELAYIKDKGALIEELSLNNYEKIYISPFDYTFEKGLEKCKNYSDFDDNQFI